MENEKEKQHFIIWLYISILLHLLMVIIMLSIKPTSSTLTDPDPASLGYDATKILFIHDEPEPVLPNEPQDEPQMATRIQGGPVISPQHSPAEPKPIQQDVPEPALSDAYKKGMRNQTNIQDQTQDGQINVIDDALIGTIEQREEQVLPSTSGSPHTNQQENAQTLSAHVDLQTSIQAQDQHISAAQTLKSVISNFTQTNNAKEDTKHTISEFAKLITDKQKTNTQDTIQQELQKVVSKKHRIADIGPENTSKVQLSKQEVDFNPPKKKLSLQDLQSGFSQFLQHGNEQYYSTQGNAQFDDAESLKRASYYRQVGQMYNNAHAIAPNLVYGSQHEQPTHNSVVQITIERSGKISNQQIITSCGIEALDRHHTRIIESIGSFPPIPKYIEAPLQITATLRFFADRSSAGTFVPIIRRK